MNALPSMTNRFLAGKSRFSVALAALLLTPITLHAAQDTATLETPSFRLTLSGANGRCELLDKKAKAVWGAHSQRFGRATLAPGGKPRQLDLGPCSLESGKEAIIATFHPLPEQPSAAIRIRCQASRDGSALGFTYEADEALSLQSISLLSDTLVVNDAGKGYLLVPVREGLLIPADSGLAFTHRFDTYAYEGCHMEMLGLVQGGAAALVTWDDPYVAVDVQSIVTNGLPAGATQQIAASLSLRKSARAFEMRFLGKGDHVTVAKAYRRIAKDRGWLMTWDQKLKENPERAKLFGAINYKLWSTLDRRMNLESTREESVTVNWTFDEAAQVAEHLKRDLKLDKVLFTLGGWIHRGYDNQHPDILPTAPECGGDAAFADCARRVMNLGYLFCLHDNYQDIYRDSPSWDESYIMRTPDGQLAKGGHWAGGLAYLTCSQKALELAKRPQNLAAVKKLSNANSYFIDTTYASGLQECFDPNHPLTRADDMKWKQELSDYARQVFGIFGSECGREWAIPHSDFFEGLTGVSGGYYHDAKLTTKLGATVVPLFELVYRDCIAMYGKYGYDPQRAAGYVLHHISIARPLNYHSIPRHLYWKEPSTAANSLALRPGIATLKQTAPREFEVTYRWTVGGPCDKDWRVFVHFTDAANNIVFQNDFEPTLPVSQWRAGDVLQGPFRVKVPEQASGTLNIRMGLFVPGGERAVLQGRDNGQRSYAVGKLQISAETVQFQPPQEPLPSAGDPGVFASAENGWAAVLHPMDRFVKNTYEVLSPLNELTARSEMTRHEFLTPDRQVQRTLFGDGNNAVAVVVNAGAGEFTYKSEFGGKVLLPPNGFLVESRTFVAFHALSWNGLRYDPPVMFTLRSLDDRPLSRSKKARVYHAFGNESVRLGGDQRKVLNEALFE